MSDLQRRTSPRFALRYRAHIDYSVDGSKGSLECVTKNVSLGGVLLQSPALIPLNCSLEFVIRAEGGLTVHPIEFNGTGEVVRVEPDPPGSGFVIAVRCAYPIEFQRAEISDSASAKVTSVSS